MASIDAVLADLDRLPADKRTLWTVCGALEKVEPGVPLTGPVPAWVGPLVAGAVAWLSTRWPQSAYFADIRRLERLGVVTLDHDDAYVLAMVSALGSRWDAQPRLDALRHDAELRDEVFWRVFEVEGGGQVSLSNVDKYSRPEAGWLACLTTLVAEGTLPRERVLRECLRALGRDFSAYRAGFFTQLHTALDPTTEELVAAQPALLRLMRSTVPPTVSFALQRLAVVDRAGALDDAAFVCVAAEALTVPPKKAPLGTLDLLDRILARQPGLAAPVAAAVATGLEHRHREVQSRALAMLRGLGARDLAAERAGLLEPTVARAAAAWLGAASAEPALLPAALEPSTVDDDRTVAEMAAALLAGEHDPGLVERFLAAAGRGTDELAALAKPARKALRHDWELRRNIAAVLLGEDLDRVPHLLVARLAEVRAIVRGKARPGVLLATPTDPAGWLDPGVFVDRLASWEGAPHHHDLVAALLKLSVDGRAEALRAARDLPGDAGAAARYALGGPPGPVGDPAVWIAAARGRAPLDDDPHLVAAGLGGAGQGRAARYELVMTPHDHGYWAPSLAVHPVPAPAAADQPTVVPPQRRGPDLMADWLPWAAQVWPHDAEPFFAADVDEVVHASFSTSRRTPPILDALRTHPGRLGPLSAAVLAAGMTTADAGHRARAAEAFAALVPPGRLDPGVLAGAMVVLAGHATANRWAATLRDSGASAAVVDVLARLLPRLPRDHHGLHALLAVLHEEVVRTGIRPVAAAGWLAGFTGPSKAARTARALLDEA
ncbi:DUF6493 family protein [Dactylosporangium sucinum]|uniref:DUF6493 domain-containing protein n=1 Tax=Dactylosporangium sucinum TaxID=1424081 RepID=A0A917U2Y6_9ACTN|nr:DUF6493 family protein [Dactylosporangium sucinum]GGM53975.1 hypothetical protein GCM10007977_064440 [Dactylosporangium sucinum]